MGFLFPCSLGWLLFPVLWSSSLSSASCNYPLIPVPCPVLWFMYPAIWLLFPATLFPLFLVWILPSSLFPVLLFLFPDFFFLLPALWFLLPLIWFPLLVLWFLFFVPVSNFLPCQWTVPVPHPLIPVPWPLIPVPLFKKIPFLFPWLLILFPVLWFLFSVLECLYFWFLILSSEPSCPLIPVLYPNSCFYPLTLMIPFSLPSGSWFLLWFLVSLFFFMYTNKEIIQYATLFPSPSFWS